MPTQHSLTGSALWRPPAQPPTADHDLAVVIGAVRCLPIKYWQPGYFFTGAPDMDLFQLTQAQFPVTPQKQKTHPLYALKPLPDQIGFTVCPCSSKKPWHRKKYRFIRNGCRLTQKSFTIDRDSYLVETIVFNVPASVARHLSFRGQVPETCIQTVDSTP